MTAQLRDDLSYMVEALALAARVPRRPWPNPPVGALVVADDGEVLGRGAHHGPGTAHAEVTALNEAGSRSRGATLYCTLEPCNHHGRTAPCAPRVAASGVRRLVLGVRDPNPRVAGGGLELVRRSGVAVTVGVAGAVALELIWPFVVTEAFARPFVLLKTATSLDGRFAPATRPGGTGPFYLTGIEARRDVHRLRRWADLVLVGAGTVVADRPALDARLVAADAACPRADPLPGYVDTDLDVHACWSGQPHLAACGRSAAPERIRVVEASGGSVILCDEREGRVDLASLLEQLAGAGLHAVLVEGGPTLARGFLARGLVDRWVCFIAPVVLGAGPGWPQASHELEGERVPVRPYELTRCEAIGPDARLVYDAVSFDDTLRRLTALAEV